MATVKDTYDTTSSFTIIFTSLASSTVGVGRQSTMVDNTSTLYSSALIGVKFTVNASSAPTLNSLIYVYLLRYNGTTTDDNAGASDAGWTAINAPLLGTILCNATTT